MDGVVGIGILWAAL